MKDVYVIKVKTKPPLSTLYPSERRYSASTVGGLSLVHLGLSILAFLLGTLAGSLQGPVLSFACLVPFVSGMLAWRRWYIDKNISFFFYGSLFSLVVSILCGLATSFEIASIEESGIGTSWRIENIFTYPGSKFVNGDDKRLVGIIEQNDTNEAALLEVIDEETRRDVNRNHTSTGSRHSGEEYVPEMTNSTEIRSSPSVRYFNGLFSFWRGDRPARTRTNLILDVNVLVTCVLEICWSILSLRISLRGMRNRSADASYDNPGGPRAQRIKTRGQTTRVEDQLRSRDVIYDENLRHFSGYRINSTNENSGPRLPLPESNKEFRERVERFLANQAAHRIVEGSCS